MLNNKNRIKGAEPMPSILFPTKISSTDNIYKSAASHKTNSMAGTISGIQSTIDTMPANSRNMRALPADSTLNRSVKLTDDAKKAISQQINELTQMGNPSYEIKTALFWQYALPLMKAQLNNNAIDDQTLIKHFTNTEALEGKIQRFSDQMDSFKQQKMGSAKATHLQEVFRALEESIETLLLPDSPLNQREPERTTSTGLKQPAARSDEVNGQSPTDESAKSHMPTGSGNIYHHCHFGDKIERIATDTISPSINVTVNVNGKDVTTFSEITANKDVPQQISTSALKTDNTVSHEQGSQLVAKERPVENKASITGTASSQITISKQEISTQTDDDLSLPDDIVDSLPLENDAVDSPPLKVKTMVREQESNRTLPTEPAEVLEEKSSTALLQKPELETQYSPPSPPPLPKSNLVTDSGNYKRVGEGKWVLKDQPLAPLSRSQSEPILNTIDTDGYQKNEEGKWIKDKLHLKTDVVLSQGASQSHNIARKKAYSLSDVRGNAIDNANAAKVNSDKATQIGSTTLGHQADVERTLDVTFNMNIEGENHDELTLQSVDISISPAKPNFSLSGHRESQQKPLKRSLSADDVRTMNNVHINSRTGKPFTHPVYSDQRVTLTGGGQVRSLSQENLYFNSDKRFKTEVSS